MMLRAIGRHGHNGQTRRMGTSSVCSVQEGQATESSSKTLACAVCAPATSHDLGMAGGRRAPFPPARVCLTCKAMSLHEQRSQGGWSWAGALCRRATAPDRWFPEKTAPVSLRVPAARICMACPLGPRKGDDGEPALGTGPCFEAALRRGEAYGVWGGVLFTVSILEDAAPDVLMVSTSGKPRSALSPRRRAGI